jgi:tRNA (guanine37-N1)-methyltransferase
LKRQKKKDPSAKVILFTPRGIPFTQKHARELVSHAQTENSGFILYCSRYEGIDERFAESWVDYEFSIGDAIYMGGEIPAMAFLEATARLVPEVLGNSVSIEEESFEMGGLEYPQYTKPKEFRGKVVPEVLLSGNHAEIAAWRQAKSISDTSKRRPDLLPATVRGKNISSRKRPPMYLGLIHYPVVDKQGSIITSSITNLDVHDIARSVRTFELDGYFLVHPSKTLRTLIKKVCDHWAGDAGMNYNPNRSEALRFIQSVATFDDMLSSISAQHGVLPKIIVTSARPGDRMVSYDDFKHVIPCIEEPLLILFGTAWGMHQDLIDQADYRLLPIVGPGEYNHLSVRSAVAIILDRLFGS